MKHLSNDEILAAVEGDVAHLRHLDACESCRTRVEELRGILALTSGIEVPEPSPLFWPYFSDRVHRAVASEPRPRVAPFGAGLVWSASFFGALAIIVVGIVVTLRSGQPIDHRRAAQSSTMPAGVPSAEAVAGVGNDLASLNDPASFDDDPAWVVMGELASQVEWDSAAEAGLLAPPGAADQVLGQMSSEEQRMLEQRLQQELQKAKSL